MAKFSTHWYEPHTLHSKSLQTNRYASLFVASFGRAGQHHTKLLYSIVLDRASCNLHCEHFQFRSAVFLPASSPFLATAALSVHHPSRRYAVTCIAAGLRRQQSHGSLPFYKCMLLYAQIAMLQGCSLLTQHYAAFKCARCSCL